MDVFQPPNFTNSYTPTCDSDVFSSLMTPSSSSGKPVCLARPRVLPPIPYPLSPAPSPSKPLDNLHEKDILGELYLNGPIEMADYLLTYLSCTDLYKCLFVCKTWYNCISSDVTRTRKIKAYRKSPVTLKYSKKKENSPERMHLNRPPIRQPMSTIETNLQGSLASRSLTPSLSVVLLPSYIRMQVCPRCMKPAREINLRRSSCDYCSFDFCKKCFMEYHLGGCKTRADKWGDEDGPTSIHIAGRSKSKDVKKRLRRL